MDFKFHTRMDLHRRHLLMMKNTIWPNLVPRLLPRFLLQYGIVGRAVCTSPVNVNWSTISKTFQNKEVLVFVSFEKGPVYHLEFMTVTPI